ncbi:MAG: hypothetical protein ACJATA_000098 [Sphingobacteriales bacterium]|jgi:hypothetical protein
MCAFNFFVKKLDGKEIESSARGRKIKDKLYNLQFDYSFDEENSEKLITYQTLRSQNLNEKSHLFSAFQGYFQENLEELFNTGGDMYYKVANQNPEFFVTKMEIQEMLTFDISEGELTRSPNQLYCPKLN